MIAGRYRELTFSPLTPEHIPLMYFWLQQPHVREFYHKEPVDRQKTEVHYLRRLAPASRTHCFVCSASQPIGYLQTYRIADYPGYGAMIGEPHGISLDLFVGDQRALRASAAVGFRYVRGFSEKGEVKHLLTLQREDVAARVASRAQPG